MKWIDDKLNTITMYRLVLYYLIGLWIVGAVLSVFHLLSFGIVPLVVSTAFLLAVGWVTNAIFADTYEAPANVESVYISALILALVITPAQTFNQLFFLAFAAALTMAGKFMIAWEHKHLFNPVALGLVLAGLVATGSATWWVGNSLMMPFVLIGGLLVIRKIRRFDLAGSFFLTALATTLILTVLHGQAVTPMFKEMFLSSPLFFFAAIMITEPLTTPPTRPLRWLYGVFTGFLFAPQVHFGGLYLTPEIALLVGNVYSYLVSPKQRLILELKEKIQLGPDLWDFIFRPKESQKLVFTPGQYLEWTLPPDGADNRGNRRYFTLASSPTEETYRLGVKFYPRSSTYKQHLLAMQPGQSLVASQLAGDFTLPADKKQKLVFLAGGIGITPFRSMLKYLSDTNEKRDIVLIFSNKQADEICYTDVFEEAATKAGVRTLYTLTDTEHLAKNWQGLTGRVSADMIRKEIPDYMERQFYVSGPHGMCTGFVETLTGMGIPRTQIHMDFFPGFV